jgi:hypothetical protein
MLATFAETKSARRSAALRALSGMMKLLPEPASLSRFRTRRYCVCGLLLLFASAVFVHSSWAQGQADTGTAATVDTDKEVAKLPYQQLVTIARNNSSNPGAQAEPGPDTTDEGSDDPEKKPEAMMLRISSTEGVAVDQITLTIMRASGPVSIDIDAKGDLEVPWSEELFDENPMVVSNQPQGTMNLGFTIAIPEVRAKVVDGKVRYQDLFKQLLEAQKAMRNTDPEFGNAGRETFAIQIMGGGDDVAILRDLGSRKIVPDDDGNVWLVYELLLFEENPHVTLPENAQVNIVPVDARHALRIRAQ